MDRRGGGQQAPCVPVIPGLPVRPSYGTSSRAGFATISLSELRDEKSHQPRITQKGAQDGGSAANSATRLLRQAGRPEPRGRSAGRRLPRWRLGPGWLGSASSHARGPEDFLLLREPQKEEADGNRGCGFGSR